MSNVEILPSGLGYYTLYMNGNFAGNFDTAPEASREAEDILRKQQEQIGEALAV